MQIAERVHSLAKRENNAALMISACRALAVTRYFLGNFESTWQYAIRGIQLVRSKAVQPPLEEVHSPAVTCLCYEALSQWHFGDTSACHATVAEAIALAKQLNDMYALAAALWNAGKLAHYERNPVAVESITSNLIELSTHQHLATWQPGGAILHGWARSASGNAADGLSWIEKGIGLDAGHVLLSNAKG
jgi:hypothetical protein